MIIESDNHVVSLSGTLHKNLWGLIQSVVLMLLNPYPQGIVIDCRRLTSISSEGIDTFVEALYEIEENRAPVVLTNLPEPIQHQIESRTHEALHRYLMPSHNPLQEWNLSEPPAWWGTLFGQTT